MHAYDDEAVPFVLVVPGLHIGQRAQAIDAGIRPEIDYHHFAAQLLRRKRHGIEPCGCTCERWQSPLDRKLVKRRTVGVRTVCACFRGYPACLARPAAGYQASGSYFRDERLLESARARDGQPSQYAAVPAESNGCDGY